MPRFQLQLFILTEPHNMGERLPSVFFLTRELSASKKPRWPEWLRKRLGRCVPLQMRAARKEELSRSRPADLVPSCPTSGPLPCTGWATPYCVEVRSWASLPGSLDRGSKLFNPASNGTASSIRQVQAHHGATACPEEKKWPGCCRRRVSSFHGQFTGLEARGPHLPQKLGSFSNVYLALGGQLAEPKCTRPGG